MVKIIVERPGEPNDRELIPSNHDIDRFGFDSEKYRENYDNINWGDNKDLNVDKQS